MYINYDDQFPLKLDGTFIEFAEPSEKDKAKQPSWGEFAIYDLKHVDIEALYRALGEDTNQLQFQHSLIEKNVDKGDFKDLPYIGIPVIEIYLKASKLKQSLDSKKLDV